MKKRNFLSKREKEQQSFAEQYENSIAEGKSLYMDSSDISMLADWYFVHKEYDKAFEVVDYGLRLHPDHEELIARKAYLYMDAGYEREVPALIKRLPQDSDDTYLLCARLASNNGEYEAAQDILNDIEEKDDLITAVEAAYVCLELDDPKSALDWLEPLKDEYGTEEPFLAVTADTAYAAGEFKQAAKCYNMLIDKDPYTPSYWYGLSRCYFAEKNYEQAIDACNYALIGDDGFAEAYVMRGNAYHHLGNMTAALEDYIQANKRDAFPLDNVYAYQAFIAMADADWEKALAWIKRAIQAETGFDDDPVALATLHTQAAKCYFHLGDYAAAHRHCTRAYSINNDEVDAYLLRGRLFFEEQDEKRGLKMWLKALNITPDAYTWYEIGNHFMELGAFFGARQAYLKVAEEDINYDSVKERLAILALMQGDIEEFTHYNDLCENPITKEEIRQINKAFETGNIEEITKLTQRILDYTKYPPLE